MSHEYMSAQYSAQTFKAFLADEIMFRRHGYSFPNAKCHTDSVTFVHSQKEFAVKFDEINENEVGRAYLEVKIEGRWLDLKNKSYKIERSQSGKISFRTYEPLFDDFVIGGIVAYLRLLKTKQ